MKAVFQICIAVLLICLSYSQGYGQNETPDDRQLVENAVNDYVIALYHAEPQRIERSVDTSLHKIGYFDYEGEAQNHVPMTYQELYDLAAKWNLSRDKVDDNSPNLIEIYDVSSKTASAKLTAVWGIDYMHLSKVDGHWKIMNIIWQSNP